MADLRTLMLLICGDCGQRMKIPGNAMGKTYKCVKCGAHIKVQADNVAPIEQAAPAAANQGDAEQPAEPMGQVLLQAHAITEEQLQAALDEQQRNGGRLFEILIRQEALGKDALHDVLSKQPGVASIDLSRFQIDRSLTELIPRDLALEKLVLPIDKLGKLLTVAMACPLDMVTIASMEAHTGLKVKAMLCRYDDIEAAVQKYYPSEGEGDGGRYTFQLPPGFGDAPATDLRPKLERLSELKVPKEDVDALAERLTDHPVDSRQVVGDMLRMPLLCIAALQASNSEVFGMQGEVDGTGMAAALLGANGFRDLIRSLSQSATTPALANLQEHGARSRQAAAALAKQSGFDSPNLLQTAALIHGLGRFALLEMAAERYGPLVEMPLGAGLLEAEKKFFKTDHIDIGKKLAAQWHFPAPLQAAIAHYLTPKEAGDWSKLAAMVGLASLLACENDEAAAETAAPHLALLGLSWENARKIAHSPVKTT